MGRRQKGCNVRRSSPVSVSCVRTMRGLARPVLSLRPCSLLDNTSKSTFQMGSTAPATCSPPASHPRCPDLGRSQVSVDCTSQRIGLVAALTNLLLDMQFKVAERHWDWSRSSAHAAATPVESLRPTIVHNDVPVRASACPEQQSQRDGGHSFQGRRGRRWRGGPVISSVRWMRMP